MPPLIKFATEMGPLAIFFGAYKFYGLLPATGILILASLVALAITFFYERKVPVMPLVSAVVLTVLGTITLLSGNPLFIKIKPTIVNALFASILLCGVYFRKGLVKYVLGAAMPLTEEGWIKFSFRFGLLFLGLAILNEVIWRNFPEDFWIKFKVFGMFPLTVIFMLAHVPFMKKHQLQEEKAE